MSKEIDKVYVARAWKDAEYRNSLTPEQIAQLPPNPGPAEGSELSEKELDGVTGGNIFGDAVSYIAKILSH